MNIKITKAKVLRFLGITKTIPLGKYEIQWIKLCKGHYDQKYNFEDENRIERLKPLFTEIYGWNPDEDNNYRDFLDCIFKKLFSLYLKIHDETSTDLLITEVVQSSFWQRPSNNHELPIERCIADICFKIAWTPVCDNGVDRFKLD
jgi:hypothetical protein